MNDFNPLTTRPWDIIGRSELTIELGIARNAISGWVTVHDDFPRLIAVVSTYPVYDRLLVLEWVRVNKPQVFRSWKLTSAQSAARKRP